ncbi:MAG: RnfABCDGE type electron transport complex subunit D [Ruminiclostridium sp.]|nr:RnfABCDGE type electron transport complex subunit D [Ruminiclostridium sp.]
MSSYNKHSLSLTDNSTAERAAEASPISPDKKRSFLGRKYHSVYGDQLVCLCALLIMAVWLWGLKALVICLVSLVTSVFSDWLCCVMTKKVYNPKDASTFVSGLCLGLLMPASIAYRYVVFGAALAMGIKHIFGGKNNYVFNPACLSYAFLAICWPSHVLMFPNIGEQIPVFEAYTGTLSTGLEGYLIQLGAAKNISLSDLLLGNFLGPIGTTHVLVLAVCGACLMFRRALSPTVTFVSFGVFLALSFLSSSYDNFYNAIIIEIIGGNILFGLLFLASDPQTSPQTFLGKIYYGMIIGILLVIFRIMTKTESSFVYVLLIANAVSLHIDLFAENTIKGVKYAVKWLKNSSGSFERVRSEAQQDRPAEKKDLGDTQEIILPPVNYNMPAVDNKIIKASKKPPKIVRGKDNIPVRKDNKKNP